MFKKLVLAFVICLFSIGVSNAEWKTNFEGKPDGMGRTIVKAWHNEHDGTIITFYDEDNDGKLDKLFHADYRGECEDNIIGIDTIDKIKTVDDFIKVLEDEEKLQKKEVN